MRREKARHPSGCKSHPAKVAPAGSNRSSCKGRRLKPPVQKVTRGDLANMQAVTRVNAEQVPKASNAEADPDFGTGKAAMSGEASDRCTRSFRRDSGDGMHGKRDDEATREASLRDPGGGSTGDPRGMGRAQAVAERRIVPRKPGNAGEGKRPQFKGNAGRSEEREIGEPINS